MIMIKIILRYNYIIIKLVFIIDTKFVYYLRNYYSSFDYLIFINEILRLSRIDWLKICVLY